LMGFLVCESGLSMFSRYKAKAKIGFVVIYVGIRDTQYIIRNKHTLDRTQAKLGHQDAPISSWRKLHHFSREVLSSVMSTLVMFDRDLRAKQSVDTQRTIGWELHYSR
jgi:hypothetical protein